MNTLEIMTPDNFRWVEFCERLEGPEGCDFRKDEKGEITWKCSGGTDKSKAKAIMESMGNIDINKSCAYFDAHGGHCDCEILFNVNR